MRRKMLSVGGFLFAFAFILLTETRAQNSSKPISNSTIPFELSSDFLVVVDGEIGDLSRLKFVLDTGSTSSVIDRNVADRLNLRRQVGKIVNFDRQIPIEWADLPELRIGRVRAEEVRVGIVKLAEYSKLAANVDGIIGLDVLSRLRELTIDYEKRSVSLQFSDEEIGKRSTVECVLIPIAVQGVTMHVVLDTGVQGLILYKRRVVERLPGVRTAGKMSNVKMGHVRGVRVKLDDVAIFAPETASNVFLINGPPRGAPPLIDGYLGPAALKAKQVQFDFVTGAFRCWH